MFKIDSFHVIKVIANIGTNKISKVWWGCLYKISILKKNSIWLKPNLAERFIRSQGINDRAVIHHSKNKSNNTTFC